MPTETRLAIKPSLKDGFKMDEPGGRPVDVINTPDGSLLVSDDFAGAIYKIEYLKK